MLDMTLEQGQQIFLKALAGNNFSTESIRAYNADITQFVDFLKSVRVDWDNPKKILRLDIVEFMNRLAGLRRTGTTRGLYRMHVYALQGINTFISSTGLCQVATSNSPLRLKKSALHV